MISFRLISCGTQKESEIADKNDGVEKLVEEREFFNKKMSDFNDVTKENWKDFNSSVNSAWRDIERT